MTTQLTPMPVDLWPVRFPCEVDTFSPTATGFAVRFATDLLHALTARQFGFVTVKTRPCQDWPPPRATPFPDGWTPWPGTSFGGLGIGSFAGSYLGYGYALNMCGVCLGGCTCGTSLTQLRLPAPAHDIVSVLVGGSPLVTGAYRLNDSDASYLDRIDGQAWPRWNNLEHPDTEADTWSVTARFGHDVPPGAELAVGELACEVLKAMSNETCGLPANVATLARQGVTINLTGRAETLRSGFTGMYLTDLFITTWNPTGAKAQAHAYSVDRLTRQRFT